jgi:hypothetical protein
LAILAGLTVLSLLAAAGIHGLQLVAKTFDAIEGGVGSLLAWTLAIAQRLLRVAKLVAQILQAGSDLLLGLRRIGIHAAAEPVGAFLDAILGVVRVEVAESVAQFAGCGALIGSEVALRIAHLLLQLGEIVGEVLALVGKLVGIIGICRRTAVVGLPETARQGGRARHLTELLRLIFFFLRKAIGFVRQGIETAAGILLLRASKKILRFAETVRGATRFSAAGLGVAHILVGGTQAFERLRDAGIGGILLAGLSGLP